MPSEMTKNVRLGISDIVSKQMNENGDLAIDVLRSIQEEASLLLERQRILDTFDIDPFQVHDDNDVIFDIIKVRYNYYYFYFVSNHTITFNEINIYVYMYVCMYICIILK